MNGRGAGEQKEVADGGIEMTGGGGRGREGGTSSQFHTVKPLSFLQAP